MKQSSPDPCLQHMPFLRLRISTNILLCPNFVNSPATFASQNGINLVNDISDETSFKKHPDTHAKIATTKTNIHLFQHNAIRLFIESDENQHYIRGIEINPSLLLYESQSNMLSRNDLPVALTRLKREVAPLLANPSDAQHIVPGLVVDGDAIAYWSGVTCEIVIAGVQLACLHGLSHPQAGPSAGNSKTRIQLKDANGDCIIRFEPTKLNDTQNDQGALISLMLKGQALAEAWHQHADATGIINKTKRLVAFSEATIADVFFGMMRKMTGLYIPVPSEWEGENRGKPLTQAKILALLSAITPIPLDELRAMDVEIRHPSKSTRKLLNCDIPTELSRLVPVPVATLFDPTCFTPHLTKTARRV